MTPEEIQDIFFLECEESLAAAEAGLAACKAGTADDETINAVFRAVHSVKGGAGAFGFVALQSYAHAFETLLSDVRDGSVSMNDALAGLLLRALDLLSDHVSAARGESDVPQDAEMIEAMTEALACNRPTDQVLAQVSSAQPVEDGSSLDLDSLLDSLENEMAPASESWLLHLRPAAGAMANGGEPMLLLRQLAELGGECIACDSGAVPHIDVLDPAQGYLGWTFRMPAEVTEEAVREIFEFVGDDCPVAVGEEGMPPAALPLDEPVASAAPLSPATEAATVAATPAAPAQSLRIDLPKLDRLIDSVGELVIAQAMLAQRLGLESYAVSEELAHLEGLTREIQESAMSIRAQPIGSVFSRVPRILRELASSTGKHVRLEVSGEGTELDKTVVERLGEPLTHLIRNAVDHGIESADRRFAAGKPGEGTLKLSAEQRSGRIVIRIADDGAGIDRERVLAKARNKGLVSPDAHLTDEEIDNLIFVPGFSTAQTVSNVSGRGVGMDVVRQTVKELGGRVSIESRPGLGTSFVLTLPLTLAIADGMVVTVGEETMIVPLTHVVESLRPDASQVHSMGAGEQMLDVRGHFIPIIPLGAAIGAATSIGSPEQGVLIVVDTEAAGQAALLVDTIRDQRQFVIKALDTHYRTVPGVAGATIMGDGRVALILDVDGIVAQSVAMPQRKAA